MPVVPISILLIYSIGLWGPIEGYRIATYLVPLTNVLLGSLLEEALVVWNSVLAVDEAVGGLN